MQYRIENKGKLKPDGSLTVKFRYWSEGKLRTVPARSVPKFKTEAEIQNYLPILEAKYDAQKQRRKLKEKWSDDYYDFDLILQDYIPHAMEKAPRTWKSKIGYIKNYVFPFFLTKKRETNLDLWFTHFIEFRKYLTNVEQYRIGGKKLMPNSVNHCILELNMFLGYMAKLNKCQIQPACDVYANTKELSRKGLEYCYTDQEAEEIYQFLMKNKHPSLADGFWLLLKTGMRISEFRGIGPNNIKMGEIPQVSLNKLLADTELEGYKCFIHFNKQVDSTSTARGENDEIKFIPLKAKRKISPEYMRYVPVVDKRAYEIIKAYMQGTQNSYKAKVYGEDLDQYSFFFDKVTSTILNFALEEFYDLNPKYTQRKTCHDARHTMATWLGGSDVTGTLQEYILGHQKSSAIRYSHLKEQILEKSKLKTKNIFSEWE